MAESTSPDSNSRLIRRIRRRDRYDDEAEDEEEEDGGDDSGGEREEEEGEDGGEREESSFSAKRFSDFANSMTRASKASQFTGVESMAGALCEIF